MGLRYSSDRVTPEAAPLGPSGKDRRGVPAGRRMPAELRRHEIARTAPQRSNAIVSEK